MINLKQEYEGIISKRKVIEEEINKLSNEEIIKRYLELEKDNKKLLIKQKELYKQIKKEEYSQCNHIWVNLFKDYDYYENKTDIYCGCIKCGLSEHVLYEMEYNPDYKSLTQDEKIMYDFMQNNYYNRGIHSRKFCNLVLGRTIYKEIMKENPNINDKEILKAFETKLDNEKATKVENKELSLKLHK